jgi:hypothetical protein
MQNKNCLCELDGVHSSISTAGIVFHYLQHASTSKASEYFGGIVLVTSLR